MYLQISYFQFFFLYNQILVLEYKYCNLFSKCGILVFIYNCFLKRDILCFTLYPFDRFLVPVYSWFYLATTMVCHYLWKYIILLFLWRNVLFCHCTLVCMKLIGSIFLVLMLKLSFYNIARFSNITTNNELPSQYIYKILIRFLYTDIYLMQWHR